MYYMMVVAILHPRHDLVEEVPRFVRCESTFTHDVVEQLPIARTP